jgi:hypothetical protein
MRPSRQTSGVTARRTMDDRHGPAIVRWIRFAMLAILVAAVGGCATAKATDPQPAPAGRAERHPQIAWRPCNRNARTTKVSTFRPLSDRRAAALVTHRPETRSYNARRYTLAGRSYPSLNAYTPTAAQLKAFRKAKISDGRTLVQFNPYLKFVDGLDGLRKPSTDDLIQWAAHKWGIPENWLRAQYVQESYWNGFQLGDEAAVRRSWYKRYPIEARVPNSLSVYTSMGMTQVKWIPDGSVGAGTEPLRWRSTAFNVDYQAAMVRFYYDNPSGARSSWPDDYSPCEKWASIGGWFEPYPWHNAGQRQYIGEVRQHLRNRDWSTSTFIGTQPSSFPPGVSFP